MKTIIYIFISVAIVLIAYNFTFLDFENLLEVESAVSLTGILAGACAILLMLILRTSRIIDRKKR